MSFDATFAAALEPRGRDVGARVICGHAQVFTDAESVKWQSAFAELIAKHRPAAPLEGSVRLDIFAAVRRPQRLLRACDPEGIMWCPQKPDVDNIRKNIQDAMREWWTDDKQVVLGQTVKVYAEKIGIPRVVVRVRTLEGVEPAPIVAALFGEGVLVWENRLC